MEAKEMSRRHHYVPRFLIKNFADENNLLCVYDKIAGRFLKNKQSSKAIFFEWDRNLFCINGDLSDNLEKMYGESDDLIAKTLEKVLSTEAMSGIELTILIYLVSQMKWRIPKADIDFYRLVKDISTEDLGLTLRPTNPSVKLHKKVSSNIQNLDIVKEMKRILLSVQPLMNSNEFEEIHKNCFIISDDNFPSLLGDFPIIEKTNTDFRSLGDFIFPLSSNKTLICKRGAKKKPPIPLFHLKKDLTIFHLAEKYVACKSKEHLEKVIQIYDILKSEDKTNHLEKYIFDFIP